MITIDEIKQRLSSFGYAVNSNDTFALTFLMRKVERHIEHLCNVNEVPDGLDQVCVDIVCGEFLTEKKATGQLTDEQMIEVVKRIQDGDTTVEMAGTSDANAIYDAFVNRLTNSYEDDIIRYRRLVW